VTESALNVSIITLWYHKSIYKLMVFSVLDLLR